jgi:hypothetical protein
VIVPQVVVSRDRDRAKKRPEGGRQVGATIAAEDELVEGGGEMAPRDARVGAALAGLPSQPVLPNVPIRLPPVTTRCSVGRCPPVAPVSPRR